MLCDVRLDDFASKRTEQRQRVRLAGADKPGIAHYIGCKDRGETASFAIASDRRASALHRGPRLARPNRGSGRLNKVPGCAMALKNSRENTS